MRALHGLIAGVGTLLAPVVHAEEYQTTLPCAPAAGSVIIARNAPRIFLSCKEGPGSVGHVVDLPSGKLLLTTRFEELQGPPSGTDLSADGDMLAAVTASGTAVVHALGAKTRAWSTGKPATGIRFVVGSRVVVAGTDIWDLSGAPRLLGTVRTQFGGITELFGNFGAVLAPDRRMIAFAGEDTTIRLHDATTLKPLRDISRLTTPCDVAFSMDGRQLFVIDALVDRITSHDATKGAELRSWKTRGFPLSIRPLPDGRLVAMFALSPPTAPGMEMAPPGWQILDLDTGASRPLAAGQRVDALAIIGGKTWCFRIDGDKVEAWTL